MFQVQWLMRMDPYLQNDLAYIYLAYMGASMHSQRCLYCFVNTVSFNWNIWKVALWVWCSTIYPFEVGCRLSLYMNINIGKLGCRIGLLCTISTWLPSTVKCSIFWISHIIAGHSLQSPRDRYICIRIR